MIYVFMLFVAHCNVHAIFQQYCESTACKISSQLLTDDHTEQPVNHYHLQAASRLLYSQIASIMRTVRNS